MSDDTKQSVLPHENMNQKNEELEQKIRALYDKIKTGELPENLDSHDRHLLTTVLPDVMSQIKKNSLQADLVRILKLAGVNYRINKSEFNLKVREMKKSSSSDERGPFDE